MSKTPNVMDLLATRKQRGVIRMSIMHLKDHIAILEAKKKSNSDCATIQWQLKKLEALDFDFKSSVYHGRLG